MKQYERVIEGGVKIDLTNGISPDIGAPLSIITRNRHNFRLRNGIPGTGKHTHSRSVRADSYVLVIFAVLFILAFAVLTLALFIADYNFIQLFSPDSIYFTILSIVIGTSTVLCINKYKQIIYNRYLGYLDKLSQECSSVEKAMESAEGVKLEILKSYRNCLEIEKEIAEVEAILATLQESFNTSKHKDAINLYSDKIENLNCKLMDARFKIDYLDEVGSYKYRSLCECFEILFTGARFWDISTYENPFSGHKWVPANFMTGIFDYIISESYPPLIKTTSKGFLLIYSECMVLARTSTDFDIYPLSEVHMECGLVPKHPHYGYVKIPKLGLAFTTNDPENMEIFVRSYEAYRNGTYEPGQFRQIDSLTEDVALYCIMTRMITREKIQKHFNIGQGRTRRILKQLSDLGIISEEDRNSQHELIVWDIEKVRALIDNYRENLTHSRQA